MSEKYGGTCPDCKRQMIEKAVLICENCGWCTCICGKDPKALEARVKELEGALDIADTLHRALKNSYDYLKAKGLPVSIVVEEWMKQYSIARIARIALPPNGN